MTQIPSKRETYQDAKASNSPRVVREQVKQKILDAIDEAIKQGNPSAKRFILITGNVGHGKTWLLDELGDDLAAKYGDAVIVTDRFSINKLLDQADNEFTELSRLCQQCKGLGKQTPQINLAEDEAQAGILDRIQRLITTCNDALNDQPKDQTKKRLPALVIPLDDLEGLFEQMQPPTLHYKTVRNAFILQLLINCSKRPVIFIAAMRSADDGLPPFLAASQFRTTIAHLPLDGFDDAQVEQLTNARKLVPLHGDFVAQQSQGNPWFVQILSTPEAYQLWQTDRSQMEQQVAQIFLEGRALPKAIKEGLGQFIRDNKNLFVVESEFPNTQRLQPIRQLIASGLVRFDVTTGFYSIVEPLANLLTGEV